MQQGEPYGHLALNGKGILPDILARILGCTLPEIERYLSELESAGVFSRTEDGTIFSRRMIRDEEIRVKRAAGGYKALNHPNVAKPKKKGHPKGYPSRIPQRSNAVPSPSSSSSSSIKDMSSDVFNHWKTVLNHPKAILDAKVHKLIADRVAEGFSPEDLKSAIDGCKASAWHMGENDRRKKFDGLGLIFRDAEHVEKFISELGGQNGNGHHPSEPSYPPVVTAPPEYRQRREKVAE